MKKIFYSLLFLFAFNSCSHTSSVPSVGSDRFVVTYKLPVEGVYCNDLYILNDTESGIDYLVVRCPYGISITRLYK